MSERPPKEISSLAIAFELLAVMWAIPIGAAAGLLLAVADTWQGRWFALTALLIAVLPRVACAAWSRGTRRAFGVVAALTGTLPVLIAVVMSGGIRVTPSADDPHRVHEQFTAMPSAWLRNSPTNLVPEGDQLAFDFTVMAFIDPILTQAGASRLRNLTTEVYREMDRAPDFRRLGSAMPDVYAELFGFRPASGQVYVYVPPAPKPVGARPALVFFHGSGGNFKGYLWELAALADRLDCVLVAPSSGMGDWRDEDSAVALESALAAATRVAAIDANRIHVIGLSNGGRAVTQLRASMRTEIKSFTLISPVFDTTAIASKSLDAPVLVITGELDDRVSLSYVEGNVREMKRRGAQVNLRTFPDADHFLMFSHRHALVDTIAVWLQAKQR